MSKTIKVPDIGDFKDVEIIDVLVAPGDAIAPEDPLITLESDKASIDIPAPEAGTVERLLVKVGDRVNQGDPILELSVTAESGGAGDSASGQAASATSPSLGLAASAQTTSPPTPQPEPGATRSASDADVQCQVLVLGAGPGGYTAAFRAADLGLDVVLVERYASLGGVCLNVGCIPSKALLHAAEVKEEAARFADFGVVFGAPQIELDALRGYKEKIVGRLTGGLKQLAKQRRVRVLTGVGRFADAHRLTVEAEDGATQTIGFEYAIIAAGSQAVKLPGFPWEDARIMDSTDALALADIPERLLVVGGGIIGLEMASVYAALGSRVTIVELSGELMPGADRDLVRPLEKRLKRHTENIFLNSKVTGAEATEAGIVCRFEGDAKGLPESDTFERVLVAVGRSPNGRNLNAEAAGVAVTERGFIEVDSQMRTNVAHVFAIGDIVGQPMLAHKATHEAKVAAEVIAGHKVHFDARAIPSVAYTHPEVAWVGVTETEAKRDGIKFEKGVFPWAASGRAIALGADDGFTKILFGADGRVIGGGIVGPAAGDLIGEIGLALEMGADAHDIALTVHPHPTLGESVGMAAEVAIGAITDILPPKR